MGLHGSPQVSVGSLHRFLMPMILLAMVVSTNQSNSEGLCRCPWVHDLVGDYREFEV